MLSEKKKEKPHTILTVKQLFNQAYTVYKIPVVFGTDSGWRKDEVN
jgi:hypothetical protein